MADSIYQEVQEKVVVELQSLDLSGIEDAEIVRRKLPQEYQFHPGITVSRLKKRYGRGYCGTSDGRDVIGYGCLITFCRGSGGLDDSMDVMDQEDDLVWVHFHNKKPFTIDDTSNVSRQICLVEHGQIDTEWPENYNIHQLIVWTWLTVPRSRS